MKKRIVALTLVVLMLFSFTIPVGAITGEEVANDLEVMNDLADGLESTDNIDGENELLDEASGGIDLSTDLDGDDENPPEDVVGTDADKNDEDILMDASDEQLMMRNTMRSFTDSMELIAFFDFESDPVDDILPSGLGLNAQAQTFGNPAWSAPDGALDGTRAVTMSSDISNQFWMHLQKGDGSPLLAGLDEFAISYDVNATEVAGGDNGWLFWVGRTAAPPKPNYERYIAVREFEENTSVRRWYKAGNPQLVNSPPDVAPVEQIVTTDTGWKHVEVVFSENTTSIYVNGELKSTQIGEESIGYIISSAGGYALVGKNQYGAGHLTGSSGQGAARPNRYFDGQIDNFKVYKPATPITDAGKVAAARDALTLPYGIEQNQVYGNITLPEEGLFNTEITWLTSHPSIVDVNKYAIANYDDRLPGMVTRPTNADTVVTMVAIIKSGMVTDTKEFNFTVKKAPAAPPETEAYLFAHFTAAENVPTDEQIYFALSEDMETFTDMTPRGTPVLTSDIGDYGVRDPYIIRSPEGDKFYLIATDLSVHLRGGWGSQPDGTGVSFSSTCLVVWESNDLLNWSDPWLVDVAGNVPGAWMAWAPEAVYDAATGDYFVFWATATPIKPENSIDRRSAFGATAANPRPAYVQMYYARTRDFITFSPAQFWIDAYGDNSKANSSTGDGSIIDTTAILSDDGYWYRSSKECFGGYNRGNRTTIDKSMEFVTIGGVTYPSLTGIWDRTNPSDGSNDTLLGDENHRKSLQGLFYPTVDIYDVYRALEGPELFRYNEKDWKDNKPTYGLMADAYGGGTGYIPFYTNDLDSQSSVAQGGAWDQSSVDLGPLRKRHGSILPITKAEYDAVMEKYRTSAVDFYPQNFNEQLTDGLDLIADFDFENITDVSEITPFIDKTGNAKAYSKRADRNNVAKSLSTDTPDESDFSWEFPSVSSNNSRRWLDIYKNNNDEPDTALLLNEEGEVYEKVVISFDNKRTNPHISSGGPNNALYLDRDITVKSESNLAALNYISTTSSRKTISINRSKGGRQGGPSGETKEVGQWNHFDIVIRPYSTALYVNGKLSDSWGTENNNKTLADILGPTGGYIHLGRGNLGNNGEHHIGLIDNFKIYAGEYPIYTITATSRTGGSITGGGEYGEGMPVELKATPNSSYSFDGWYEDDVKVPNAGATYSFTASVDRTLEARFNYSGSPSPGGSSSGGTAKTPVTEEEPEEELEDTTNTTQEATDPGTSFDGWTNNPFDDVSSSDWFVDAVRFAFERELMVGTAVNRFSPNMMMNRAMLVTVLYRLEGSPTVSGTSSFSDVRSGQWYTNALLWAEQNDIVAGYNNGTFGLTDLVTREQAVAILYRYVKAKGLDVSRTSDLSSFTDAGSISDWALEAMKWAVAVGIIQGRTATTIVPKGTSTRAEVAMILERYTRDFLNDANTTEEQTNELLDELSDELLDELLDELSDELSDELLDELSDEQLDEQLDE